MPHRIPVEPSIRCLWASTSPTLGTLRTGTVAPGFWALIELLGARVSKTVLAEMTDATNIGDVFAITPIMWGLGNAVGPIVGGLLANPAQRWPETFGKLTIFIVYPYLLPCAVAASFSFVVYLCALYSLQETHPSVLEKQKTIPDETTGLLDNDRNGDNHGAEPAGPQIHQALANSSIKT
ncbi:hypothetical protein BDZ89DRAFT_1141080 [Hymenopellis radicata]|nr:hypothetical protein BDZ89DRAFT_1141080 [Hymenopellis radicata]